MKIIIGSIVILSIIFFLTSLEKNKVVNISGEKEVSELISSRIEGREKKIDQVSKPESVDARKIFPYREKLPRRPTEQEVMVGFPDQNQNGVRDDIEIDIVEDFQDDIQLVEQFFAAARAAKFDLDISEQNLLTEENLKKSMDLVDQVSACGNYYFNSFYKQESGWDWIDMYNLHIHSKIYNTEKRGKFLRQLEKASHGMRGGFEEINFKICSDFSQQSKKLFNLN